MKRVSIGDRQRLADLEARFGNVEVRTLLTGEGNRLVRPERFQHLLSGSGRLSEAESERIKLLSTNSNQIKALLKKNENKKSQYKVRRAVRTWVTQGKSKGVDFKTQSAEDRERQIAAIKALRFLGIDPGDGTFYVQRRKV